MSQQTPHNFWNSLKIEQDKSLLADAFYYSTFGVESITRFNSGSARDMEFQRMDIDVQLNAWGRHANVSEKFRDHDFNDLYLELYSMYPNVPGWMEQSEATHLAYFFPKRMIWLNKKELITCFNQFIQPQINEKSLAQLVNNSPKKSTKVKAAINIKGESFDCYYINAFNKTKVKEWNTLGVSVPFHLLDKLDCNYKVYPI